MSDQPPYPPPAQGPHPTGGPPPTRGWGQQPPAYGGPAYGVPQPSQQPPWGPPPPLPHSAGAQRKTSWPLVVGALVAGLVVGGAAAGGIVAATAGDDDPTESEEYRALEDDLAAAEESLAAVEGSAAPAPPAPAPETGTRDVDGWTVTEPEISADFADDFAAEFTVTNDRDRAGVALFSVVLTQAGSTVGDLTCVGNNGNELEPGGTTDVTCFSTDDYVEGGWDTVDIAYDGF